MIRIPGQYSAWMKSTVTPAMIEAMIPERRPCSQKTYPSRTGRTRIMLMRVMPIRPASSAASAICQVFRPSPSTRTSVQTSMQAMIAWDTAML